MLLIVDVLYIVNRWGPYKMALEALKKKKKSESKNPESDPIKNLKFQSDAIFGESESISLESDVR